MYDVCLISVRGSVSDQATKVSVLNIGRAITQLTAQGI